MAEERERAKNDDQDKAFPRAKMAESSEPDSVGVSTNSRPENPNPDDFTKNTDYGEATGNGGNKGRSCKGCLYYSSQLKSDSRNPLCVGLSRSIPNGSPNFSRCFSIWIRILELFLVFFVFVCVYCLNN